jgi:hypothetical protein
LRNLVFLSGSAGHGSGFGSRAFGSSSGLLYTGHGSPKTAVGTTGHGGSDLRKDRVSWILPDPSGWSCGSQVSLPGLTVAGYGLAGNRLPLLHRRHPSSNHHRISAPAADHGGSELPGLTGSAPSLPISRSLFHLSSRALRISPSFSLSRLSNLSHLCLTFMQEEQRRNEEGERRKRREKKKWSGCESLKRERGLIL